MGASTIGQASHLWSSLPAGLADKFRPHADSMARYILQEIQRAVPEYAQPLEGAFGELATQGVELAILHCLDTIENPHAPHEEWRGLYRHLGRVEFSEGRSLDSLQAAYRVGGRAAWRYIGRVAQTLGLPTEFLRIGAEAIFAYIDELSALSIEGYTEAQTRDAGTLARRRRRLLELILSGAGAAAVTRLAAAAHWRLPERVAAVALEPRADQHEIATPTLDAEVLMDLEGAEPCLLVGDPERHLADLRRQLGGWRAAVGPTVPLGEAATSLEWARRTIALVQRGIVPDAPLTRCTDHLLTLVLLHDEFLVAQLAARVLAPFDPLTDRQRERLKETLLAWLQSGGGAPEIAQRLGVHPQTVRYRLRQLDGLFGDRLQSPDERLAMEIALRAERLSR